MSSRSKKFSSVDSGPADIVDFRKTRLPTERSRPLYSDRPATLLSIRQHLRYKACVAITEKPLVEPESRKVNRSTLRVMRDVRTLLDKEFGSLRVHRHRQLLIVSHHCVEGLIGGLLRVQFLSNQIDMPSRSALVDSPDSTGIPLSWGVGDSLFEAETSRLRQIRSELEPS